MKVTKGREKNGKKFQTISYKLTSSINFEQSSIEVIERLHEFFFYNLRINKVQIKKYCITYTVSGFVHFLLT